MVLVLGAVLVIAFALALLTSQDRPVGGEAPPSPDVAAPGPPPSPPALPLPPPEELPPAVQRYLAATPYPADSGRLTEDHGDLLEPNRRHERPRPIPETGPDPETIITSMLTADRYFYFSDETLHARLEVEDHGRRVAVRLLEASVTREGRAGAEGALQPVAFTWTGDHHALDLPLDLFGDHHGNLLLHVRFEYAPGQSYEETLRAFLTPIERLPARFTGLYDEGVDEGSLRIDVGVAVDEPGFYRFDANLRSLDGSPVAFATFKGELDRADLSFPLRFYGKVLRDAGRSGPFVLGELRGYRFLDGEHPDRELLPRPPRGYVTGDVALETLTDEPHVSAHEQNMVQLMLEDVARGISLDLPAPPEGSEPFAAPTAAP